MRDLRELYEEHIAYDNDSQEHKWYMLNNDRCFFEWVEENYPDRIEEL